MPFLKRNHIQIKYTIGFSIIETLHEKTYLIFQKRKKYMQISRLARYRADDQRLCFRY